jgi:hypothetical protein
LARVLSDKPTTVALGSTGLESKTAIEWRGLWGKLPGQSWNSSTCSSLYERAVHLPPVIDEILVSTVSFGEVEYISGLRIVAPNRPDILLGYIYSRRETSLKLSAKDGTPGVLTGFVTALGARGIYALKAMLLDGSVSSWAGKHDKKPKSLRLCMGEQLSYLKAEFDVSVPYCHLNISKSNILSIL